MAKLYGYRRKDFAFRYLSKLTGREAPFDEKPAKRDEAIARLSRELGDAAWTLAKTYGLSAGDALNVAAAIRQSVEEFVTSELPGKPIFRVTGIKVVSIHVAQI